jgi:hypothetical protein
MGIDAEIAPRTRDNPAEVLDSRGVFAHFLGASPVRDSVCLRFIDPYGDTIFNSLQLPVLLEELEIVRQANSAPELRSHVALLINLVSQALANGPHTFVKFRGD